MVAVVVDVGYEFDFAIGFAIVLALLLSKLRYSVLVVDYHGNWEYHGYGWYL